MPRGSLTRTDAAVVAVCSYAVLLSTLAGAALSVLSGDYAYALLFLEPSCPRPP